MKLLKPVEKTRVAFLAAATLLFGASAAADDEPIHVNVDNFVRAETGSQIDRFLQIFVGGEINTWAHIRTPTPINNQSVIRMNRDTLYSAVIVDISEGAKLTIPESDDRYLSIMIINENHYINKVFHEAGVYELTMDEFETPYVMASARILADTSDAEDIQKANALQNQVAIEAVSAKPYVFPNYDSTSYKATYDALIELSRGLPAATRMFGAREEVDPVRHLIGTAFGWGGLPDYEANYLNVEPGLPVGAYQITVEDVPVNAFWSISLYNKDGFFEENEHDAYSVNNISGTPNEDGSFTVHFGGDPANVNFLPIMEGWNYIVRLYQPRQEILNGSWTFPSVQPVR